MTLELNQSAAPALPVPTGTVTFMFSDIEGSTQRWETYGVAMQAALRTHDALVQTAIAAHHGHVFKTVGDAFCAAFHTAPEAIAAAIHAQRDMAAQDWSAVGGLRIRLAIHAGTADERDGDYYGPTVNRVARLLSTAHGGQSIVSGIVAQLAGFDMPPQCSLRDLGQHRLKDLSQGEHVYQVMAPDLRADFPPLRSLETLSNNLPLQFTRFIGRTTELADIKAMLTDGRLVTLVGSGGVGKTRVALQVAADVLDAFPDGVWFVDLAPVVDPERLAGAIADVVNVDDLGSQSLLNRLIATLKQKHSLIVLDNCEQIIQAAAGVVNHILHQCGDVKILATSRQALNIGPERTYRLPSLEVPSEGEHVTAAAATEYSAVKLFVERAQRAQSRFELTDANATVVANIVRDLDGVALAIELAAARVTILSPQTLAERLRERLRMLTGGDRAATPRQQTLRALIGWSYDLLSDAERMLLRHCGIFRGGWTLEAVAEICGATADEYETVTSLEALVDKSLVVCEPGGPQTRYRLLESTRYYALERLKEAGEHGAAAGRHCGYFTRQYELHYDAFRRTNFDRWISATRIELENCRAAIEWGLLHRNDVEGGAAIVACLSPLWLDSFRSEGRELAGQAASALNAEASQRTRGLVLLATAYLDNESGHSVETAEQAMVALKGDEDAMYAEAIYVLGVSLVHTGRFAEALMRFGEASVQARRLHLPQLLSSALSGMGGCAMLSGDRQRALLLLEEAIALSRAQGDYRRLAPSLHNVAELRFCEGDFLGALQSVADAEASDREHGCERSLMFGLVNMAAYSLALNHIADAHRSAREALEIAVRRQHPMQAAWAIQHLSNVAAVTGYAERAACLLGYVDAVCNREGTVREPTEQFGYDRVLAVLRDTLPRERLEQLMLENCFDDRTAVAEALDVREPTMAIEATG